MAAGDVEGVSVDSVADGAGVSRALVYKHFANRTEILTALYERESARLHDELASVVTAAPTLEAKYRALCHGSLAAAKERGQIFDGLRSAAGMHKGMRQVQRERDRATAHAYVRLAMRELGVPREVAEPVTSLLLGAVTPMLSLWHAKPTDEYAVELEEAYMCVVAGTLAEMRRRGHPTSSHPDPSAASGTTGAGAGTPPAEWFRQRLEQASAEQLREMLASVVTAMADAAQPSSDD